MIVVACIPGITAEESRVGFKRELGKALWKSFVFQWHGKAILECLSWKKMKTREAIISKEKSSEEKKV